MAGGPRNIKKGEILFKEGDSSDAMFVIKSGKFEITKSKGSSEIRLAQLSAGDMMGEMAFFDNKPRSAGARALIDSVVIELPFASLNAQFKTFPEWLKAIVRTVNTHLRNANQKIKNLERTDEDDGAVFPPHAITPLVGVLALVTHRYGEKVPEGFSLSGNLIRKFTIQVFQQPTNKMEKLMAVLAGLGHMKVEDLGEGRQKMTVFHLDMLFGFLDFYNEYLFADETERTTIEEKEMKPISALIHYGKKGTPDAKGMTKVNLTQMQNDSMRDLGFFFSVDDVNSLCSKKVLTDKMASGDSGSIVVSFNIKELEPLYSYWELIFALQKITRSD